MALVNLGSASLAVAVPGAATLDLALLDVCNVAAPNVSAQITAAASFSPSIGLDLTQQISLLNQMLANLNAALAAIPPIPTLSLSAQVALAASILVDLNALLALVNAKLAIQVSFASILATAGVEVLAWDGARNALGPALTAERGGATTHSNAVVLYTQSGAAWTAMQALLRTS